MNKHEISDESTMHMMTGVVRLPSPGECGATQSSFRVKRRPMLGDVPAQGASLSKGGWTWPNGVAQQVNAGESSQQTII